MEVRRCLNSAAMRIGSEAIVRVTLRNIAKHLLRCTYHRSADLLHAVRNRARVENAGALALTCVDRIVLFAQHENYRIN